MLDTHAETHAKDLRRVAGMAKLRHDLSDDFAADQPVRTTSMRRSSGVRITLPRGFPGSRLGRIAMGILVAVMFGIFALFFWEAQRYLLADPRLVLASSSSIEILGNQHLTRAQLLSVFDEAIDRNILSVSLAQRREELERLPWVEHATVMRLFPDRLRIAITERTPAAYYRQGSHIGLVDANGVLLDLRPETPGSTPGDLASVQQYSFPVVSGIMPSDPLSVRSARMKMYERFMTELRGSGDGIVDRLSEVDLSSPEDVKALIPAGQSNVLVHFGENHFLERYRHFEENLPKWRTDYPKLASADMRYPRQVVLEMAAGTAVPVASSHANAVANMPIGTPAGPAVGSRPAQVKRTPVTRAAAKSLLHLPAPPTSQHAAGAQ